MRAAPAWPGRIALASIAVTTLALLAQVRSWSPLGNGDYYLRNATDIVHGHLPHSRYSGGFPVVLSPIAAIARGDRATMTLAASLLTALFGCIALVLVHRWLAGYLRPWTAALTLTVFALGQVSAAFLGRGEVESLALFLVTGMLLAARSGRWPLAVVLTACAVLVRVALGPFLGVFWLLHLRHRPRSAVAALLVLGGGLLSHLAVGPTKDQSYVQIGGAIYGVGNESSSSVVSKIVSGVLRRAQGYVEVGIPRLVWPVRLLQTPPGIVVGIVTTLVVLTGLWLIVRAGLGAPTPRTQAMLTQAPSTHANLTPTTLTESTQTTPTEATLTAADDAARLAARASIAFLCFVGALLLWPTRDGDTARMIIPAVTVPLLALGTAAQMAVDRWHPPRRLVAAAVIPVLLLGILATGSLVAQRWTQPDDEKDYTAAVADARGKVPAAGVVAGKPAYVQLALDVPGYEYPAGVTPATMPALMRRTGSCALVIDGLDRAFPTDLRSWIDAHTAKVLSRVGQTSIVLYDSPRCRR